MNKQAIFHKPKSNYAYAFDIDKLHIRIRTAKDDIDNINLIYGVKYKGLENIGVMEKILSDDLFDYYQFNISSEDTRIGYYFELFKNGKKTIYGETGFMEEFKENEAHCHYFQYPIISCSDLHTIPKWIDDAIFYQIFMDRFFNGNDNLDKGKLAYWDEKTTPTNVYGGDIKGVTEKLDYLQNLGINAIYFTPIFQADSNHKYDTADYLKIDKAFGNEKSFANMVDTAHSKGIKIVLDAVFNHCGFYFSQFQDVVKNQENSIYKDWFHIESFPLEFDPPNYKTFGFEKTMPKLNTSNQEVKDYIFSVVRFWTEKYKIDGWRLDVSDEVDHKFWRKFRDVVKEINREALIIGENWHDSYPWLMGDQFDSVMNYPVEKACVNYFAKEEINSAEFSNILSNLLMRNTDQVNYAMLNLLDSHDTLKFLMECKGDFRKLKNAATFLFTYIGVPCTYNGTEIGQLSENNAFLRTQFNWDEKTWNMEVFNFYKEIIKLRKDNIALRKGTVKFISNEDLFIMERAYKNEKVVVIINNSTEIKKYQLDCLKDFQEVKLDCLNDNLEEGSINKQSCRVFKKNN